MNYKIRGFEPVQKDKQEISMLTTQLPFHGTKNSGGYDFYSKEEVMLAPGAKHRFSTDVKVYMGANEVLKVYTRSSIGMKKGLKMTNGVGIIDSDYYGNSDNDGNILIELENTSDKPQSIEVGERIAQGIFMIRLEADKGTYSIPKWED